VGDRVHVLADLADELGLFVIVEVADQMGRECGVMESFSRVEPSRVSCMWGSFYPNELQ
jgi:hypothetical protein